MLAGASFPTAAVIAEPAQIGELRYIDDETYPTVTHEEIESTEEEAPET